MCEKQQKFEPIPQFGPAHPGHVSLLCPQCGGVCTHQGAVVAFMREAEDSKEGISVLVQPNRELSVKRSMAGNPSSRRNGLSIAFSCETCNRLFCLNVYQHKGTTYLGMFPSGWRSPEDV